MSLVLSSVGQEQADQVVVGEVVSRDVALAGVTQQLPSDGAAALVRVPDTKLDPFKRLLEGLFFTGSRISPPSDCARKEDPLDAQPAGATT